MGYRVLLWMVAGSMTCVFSADWIRPGHSGAARASAVSERFIATGGDDGSIHLWERASYEFVKSLRGPSRTINDLSFSPNGDMLASASADGSIHLFGVPSGSSVLLESTPGKPQIGLGFQSQSNRLVTASASGVLSFWNLEDRSLAGKWTNGAAASAFALSPDGSHLALGSGTTIQIISLSGNSTITLEGHTETVQSIDFSPDGATLISGAGSTFSENDPFVRVWDVFTGGQISELAGHIAGVRSVAFAPNPNNIVSVGFDNVLITWDLLTMLPTYFQPLDNPEGISIPTDARLIIVGSQVIDLETITISNLVSHVQPIQVLAFSRDGKALVSDDNWDVRVWDSETGAGQPVQEYYTELRPSPRSPGSGGINRVGLPISFSPDGEFFLAQDRLWSLTTGQNVMRLPRSAGAVAPDWLTFLVSSYDEVVANLYLFPTGEPFSQLIATNLRSASALSFSPSGNRIAAAGGRLKTTGAPGSTINIWGPDGNHLQAIETDLVRPNAIAFSPEEDFLACGAEENGAGLAVYSTATGLPVLRLRDTNSPASAFAFFPDNTHIAWGRGKGIEIWNLRTKAVVATLANELQNVSALAISPDGSRIAAGRMDGTLLTMDSPLRREEVPVQFSTTPGEAYSVEMTTDFRNWTPVQSFTAAASDIKLSVPSGLPFAFYRLRQN